MRRFAGILLTLSLLGLGSPAGAEPWNWEPGTIGPDENSFEIVETLSFMQSSGVQYRFQNNGENWMHYCAELGQEPCTIDKIAAPRQSSTSSYFVFSLTMPSCEGKLSKDWCIEDFRVYKSGGSKVSAKFEREVSGLVTAAQPDFGIPAGGTMPLYSAAPESGFGGLKFAVYVRSEFNWLPDVQNSTGRYAATNTDIVVAPFEVDSSRPYPDPLRRDPTPFPGLSSIAGGISGCAWVEANSCGKVIDFPEGIRVGLSIRSSAPLKEFFNGRLVNTDVDVIRDAGLSKISVDADPVAVPRVALRYPESSGLRPKITGAPRPGYSVAQAWSYHAVKAISEIRDYLKDTAPGMSTMWRLSSIGVGGFGCFENTPFAGIVTTNATAYEGTDPPRLSGSTIDYRVAGLHYLPNGRDLFEGSYELILRSEVARCLYGYSSAPISAKVSVVGIGGEQKVATTEVSERDGWLKLSAQGFTFSENKIQAEIKGTPTRAPLPGQPGVVQPNPAQPGAVQPRPAAPIASKPIFRSSLPPFAPNSAKLSKAQLASIARLVKPSVKTITCTTAFAQTKEAALARRQAESVCEAAKKIAKKAKVTSKIMKLPISQAGLVEIRTN
jgi:hypothetical protein